jgi:hypothetical protein
MIGPLITMIAIDLTVNTLFCDYCTKYKKLHSLEEKAAHQDVENATKCCCD